MIRMRALKWMARAIATDWRWPPESDFTGSLKRRKFGIEAAHHLAGLRFHGDRRRGCPSGHQLAAKIQVGGGVDIVGQRQRLVDGLDAVFLGVARIADLGLLAVDQISPESRL